jgi:enoyl-CoA hydratase/carnithine racemase
MSSASEGNDIEHTVLYEVHDGVALITLNRPKKLNAVTNPMRARYLALLARAGGDADVGAIVVTGAGRAYCAGADFGELEVADGERAVAENAKIGQRPDLPISIGKPIIAAINGPVAGVGLADALMTDLRFAAESATFTTVFSRYGLVAEGGMSWLLPRLVGTARALDLLWSSRTITAREALEFGLVQRVYPAEELLPATLAFARELLDHSSPYSLATMKRQVYGDWEVSLDRALERMFELVVESLDASEFATRFAGHLSKRHRGG